MSSPDELVDIAYMRLALIARAQADCIRNRVGAALVLPVGVVLVGHNGTPDGMKRCLDGGCVRCANPKEFPSGQGYDMCLCVHAEQNALLKATRIGVPVIGGTIYSTMRPCFGCTKEIVQVGIKEIVFLDDWRHKSREVRHVYDKMKFPVAIRQMYMPDLEGQAFVVGDESMDEHGHSVADQEQLSFSVL